MIWIFPAIAGLLIVYFAMRSSRFRRFAEPVLSILVALGLVSAFVVWMKDGSGDSNETDPPPFTQSRPAHRTGRTRLGRADIHPQPPRIRATGSPAPIVNRSAANLTNFNLTVTLQDCPGNVCTTVGEDTALILARVPAGREQTFETFFTFPARFGVEPAAPKWTTQISNIRGVAAQ